MAFNSSAYTLRGTVTATLTAASAAVYTNNTYKPVKVRYITEISSHISMTGAASTADAMVPANHEELLNVNPGKSITAIRGAAESDSTVWITEITQV